MSWLVQPLLWVVQVQVQVPVQVMVQVMVQAQALVLALVQGDDCVLVIPPFPLELNTRI
jgi:hypothetical protein